jgi:hypothetical protein
MVDATVDRYGQMQLSPPWMDFKDICNNSEKGKGKVKFQKQLPFTSQRAGCRMTVFP